MRKIIKSFASDNYSGVHPKIMNAIVKENSGHAPAYGFDSSTLSAEKEFKKLFSNDISAYFVINGTGANISALSSITSSFGAIICSEHSHIYNHECNSIENATGCKLIPITSTDGKISIKDIKKHVRYMGDMHRAQPQVISITQPTELGRVYSIKEIKQLSRFAHESNMYVHMDGARIANAVSYLGQHINKLTQEAGVDVLCFGGTKNGMMFGEAVIFFNMNLAENFKYIRKQNSQLISKMRFLSTQFIAYLKDDIWLKNAGIANEMATYLFIKLREIDSIKIVSKPECNELFVSMPISIITRLKKKCDFDIWNESTNLVRFVTSFDTEKSDIDKLLSTLNSILHHREINL